MKLEWYRIIIKIVMDHGKAVTAIGRIQNIHQEKMEREQLVQISRLDGLTGIYNNATVKKVILGMMDQNKGTLALGIIDLDYFKEINDRYGHFVGDQVLIQTASALQEVFWEEGKVGRLGGDEFIVCVPYGGKEQLEQKCRKLFENLESRREKSGYPIPTVSIGISLSRLKDDFTAMYQRADTELYKVKNEGKGNFSIEEDSAARHGRPGR